MENTTEVAISDDRSSAEDQSSLDDQSSFRTCPDCGWSGAGNYCANCGEEMEPRVLRIRHYIRDVFQELLSLDSKFLQSIPALLFRPGFLAAEFAAGRRRRYLSPLRLHIIIGILLFLSINYTMRTRIETQLDTANKQQNIDSVLSVARTQSAARGDTTKIPTVNDIKHSSEYIQGMATEIGPYVLLLSSTPAFALCLALLYRKRKKLFVEHLMFSLYFLSFAYLILIPAILWLHKILFPISGIVLCVYLYFAIRRFYSDRGFSLFLRSFACIVSCAFIGVFAFGLSYLISMGIGMALGNIPNSFHGSIQIK
jgi:hypothetical protein